MLNQNKLLKQLGIEKIVIWGLKKNYHSHYFIHLGFFNILKNKKIKVLWVEDKIQNNIFLDIKTLVIAVDVESKNLEFDKGAYYCTHNIDTSILRNISKKRIIKLQVITYDNYKTYFKKSIKFDGVSYYDKTENTLFQSWGSSIEEKDFQKPVSFLKNKLYFEFFVGSIWNNELNQGNFEIIDEYRNLCKSKNVTFVHCKHIPEKYYSSYIKYSRYGISIVGTWQKNHGYTPCRVFKAIASGKLGMINSNLSMKIYDYILGNNNLSKLIENYEELNEKKLFDLIEYQQNEIKKETYAAKISNILYCLKIKQDFKN